MTLTTRIQAHGVGLCVYLTKAVAEAAHVERGDLVEVSIRRRE